MYSGVHAHAFACPEPIAVPESVFHPCPHTEPVSHAFLFADSGPFSVSVPGSIGYSLGLAHAFACPEPHRFWRAPDRP